MPRRQHFDPPNARFWVWWPPADQFVKLTLRPGDTIETSYGGPHEEGWSAYHATYHYDAERLVVVCHVLDEGRDCDGGHRSHAVYECPCDDLRQDARLDNDGHVVLVPLWQRRSASQWDEYAEQMGY